MNHDDATQSAYSGPELFVVNFAHTGLRCKKDRAAFRVVGAFGQKTTAQAYSDMFGQKYGQDCFLIERGVTSMIPKDYTFATTDGQKTMVQKCQRLQQAHAEAEKAERTAFNEYVKTKKKECADRVFDFEKSREDFMRLQADRATALQEAKQILSGDPHAISAAVDVSDRGAFTHAVVSFIQDTTEGLGAGQREPLITVHGVFEDVSKARAHIEKELSSEVTDSTLFVVDMFQWVFPDMAFCEPLIETIDTVYRNNKQNDIMEFKVRGKRAKVQELNAKLTKARMPKLVPQPLEIDETPADSVETAEVAAAETAEVAAAETVEAAH